MAVHSSYQDGRQYVFRGRFQSETEKMKSWERKLLNDESKGCSQCASGGHTWSRVSIKKECNMCNKVHVLFNCPKIRATLNDKREHAPKAEDNDYLHTMHLNLYNHNDERLPVKALIDLKTANTYISSSVIRYLDLHMDRDFTNDRDYFNQIQLHYWVTLKHGDNVIQLSAIEEKHEIWLSGMEQEYEVKFTIGRKDYKKYFMMDPESSRFPLERNLILINTRFGWSLQEPLLKIKRTGDMQKFLYELHKLNPLNEKDIKRLLTKYRTNIPPPYKNITYGSRSMILAEPIGGHQEIKLIWLNKECVDRSRC